MIGRTADSESLVRTTPLNELAVEQLANDFARFKRIVERCRLVGVEPLGQLIRARESDVLVGFHNVHPDRTLVDAYREINLTTGSETPARRRPWSGRCLETPPMSRLEGLTDFFPEAIIVTVCHGQTVACDLGVSDRPGGGGFLPA